MDSTYKDKTDCTVTPLFATATEHPKVTKVGIVPFIAEDGGWKVLAMKPQSKKDRKYTGPSLFQIAKGTRHISERDMESKDIEGLRPQDHEPKNFEPLLATALREGKEEIGLKKENISHLWDAGVVEFLSAGTGAKKLMHLFVAEIKNEQDFLPFESSTKEVAWIKAADVAAQMRADHAIIVNDVMGKVMRLKGLVNDSAGKPRQP